MTRFVNPLQIDHFRSRADWRRLRVSAVRRFHKASMPRLKPNAQLVATLVGEMRPVDDGRDRRVLVSEQVARLLQVLARQRCSMPECVEVRQIQLATLDCPQHVLASLVDHGVAVFVVLEQLRKRRRAIELAGPLRRPIKRSENVALPERPTRLRAV
jgi:hypothetical protein